MQLAKENYFQLADTPGSSGKLTSLLLARHANSIVSWMDSDPATKKHFPDRKLFKAWANTAAPTLLRSSGNLLPAVLPTLRQFFVDNNWETVS